MPAGPIGTEWLPNSWVDTAWEAGSWGGAAVAQQVGVIAQVGPPRPAPRLLLRKFGGSTAYVYVESFGSGRVRRIGHAVAVCVVSAFGAGRKFAQAGRLAVGALLRTQHAVRITRPVAPVEPTIVLVPTPLSRQDRHLVTLARQPGTVSDPVDLRGLDDDEDEILRLLEVA